MADIIIKHAYVITLDENRRIVKDGAVVIEGQHIVEVGKSAQVTKEYSADIEIDANQKVVMPGLIDCHVHVAQALLRGVEDSWSLIPWIEERVGPLQSAYNPQIARVATLLACLEMIKTGTTCFAESMIYTHFGFDEIVETVTKTGLRASLAKTVLCTPESLKEAKGLLRKWHRKVNDRLQVWLGPRRPPMCSPELYKEVATIAREHKTGVHVHMAECYEDVNSMKQKYGKTAVNFAHEVGLTGPDVLLVHAIWLSEEGIGLLSKTKTNVCHCPSSNMKLASGFAKVPEMIKEGVNVALGCDGAPSNDSYDMIQEMKQAALIHKGRLLDPKVINAERVIEMATRNGANALGWSKEIGSLETGKKADIIIIDLNRPHMVPYRNPPSNLVYAGMGSDVDTVIVDGKILMEHRRVKTIDEQKVLDEAVRVAETIDSKAGIEIKPHWTES